jgi:hypothetical protein
LVIPAFKRIRYQAKRENPRIVTPITAAKIYARPTDVKVASPGKL